MDRERALAVVRKQLTEQRYEHTVRVTDTAVALAVKYGVNREKAELAGIFHDYAKNRPLHEMNQIITEEDIPSDLANYPQQLWHAHVGAFLVQREAGISDEDVLAAIAYHTTGRAGMSSLEKVVFLADYIEPGRNFPGVEHVRHLAESELNTAVVQALANTISFLLKAKVKIHPDTLAAYNDLL
ncbi:MAG TPA: bis(5'-nucleosyl)-tetraphosphatase (symmetrical) YqeK [Bacillales bacterium]|nr:bis(5'-nucleosyl)-tetraphosphatase (symmetrical) YqeK [Bacillales bacterium]